MIILYTLTLLLPVLLILVIPAGVFAGLRSWRRTLMWEAGLLLASGVALLGYFRVEDILPPLLPIPAFIPWALKILAVLSPACIAVAWSRIIGANWRLSLLLFPLVPGGMLVFSLLLDFPFAS